MKFHSGAVLTECHSSKYIGKMRRFFKILKWNRKDKENCLVVMDLVISSSLIMRPPPGTT